MKRKAIEKIEPAKTRKKGHIATVQTLDDRDKRNLYLLLEKKRTGRRAVLHD